jgi:large subunit ribosomal protein L17
MRHGKALRKLGRTTEHRLSLLRNLSTSLFDKERISTTLPKAKELRPFAERLITLARKDNLHARRRVARSIQNKAVLKKLFDTLGPRFAQRNGGYSRILKLGWREGDGAEMALVELLGSEPVFDKGDKKSKKKKKKEAAAEAAAHAHDARETEGPADAGEGEAHSHDAGKAKTEGKARAKSSGRAKQGKAESQGARGKKKPEA